MTNRTYLLPIYQVYSDLGFIDPDSVKTEDKQN